MSEIRFPIISAGGACAQTAGVVSGDGLRKLSMLQAPAKVAFAGNALVVTLGCAKNLVDSELMLGALHSRGFRIVNQPEVADLIVVNTCAFLQSAVEEGIERILELSEYKESGRCRKLVVAGCMVERYRAELEQALPEVDQFLSTDEITSVGSDTTTTAECFDGARRPYFLYDESLPRVISTGAHSAYVKIAEGCDRPCAFCIIPKIRGAFRSRTVDSVVSEIEMLREQGVREFNLIGQDLTAYGTDLQRGKPLLVELLGSIDATLSRNPGRFWTRLLYAYPVGVTAELIDRIISLNSVCLYLDLPLQHISKPVLKSMRRPLGEKGSRQLIDSIRTQAPSLALRTTFIVGFPGETEKDVELLEQFVLEGHFTHVGVFTYSQEEEAVSFDFPEQIADELKEERRGRIMQAQQKVVAERMSRTVGKTVTVLLEGEHADSPLLISGRCEWQAPETDGEVVINDVEDALREKFGETLSADTMGHFAQVEITEIAGYDLVGALKSIE